MIISWQSSGTKTSFSAGNEFSGVPGATQGRFWLMVQLVQFWGFEGLDIWREQVHDVPPHNRGQGRALPRIQKACQGVCLHGEGAGRGRRKTRRRRQTRNLTRQGQGHRDAGFRVKGIDTLVELRPFLLRFLSMVF